ncbi:MAG: hypothetical protein LV479_10215 [Methylacidiphilales bacterium]|nr:hypothetical protein [Candidatus Methylacidiphilales bacterium]
MPGESEKAASPSFPPPGRQWAEQLAIGMALVIGILIFMAVFHPVQLTEGAKVLGPNHLWAYGWASAVGIILQLVLHEVGTFVVAWRVKLPLRFRLFPLGANATAILQDQPRNIWIDAVVGLAGPITGTLVSLLSAGTYYLTDNPFFMGMACVGYFYNLFTLIPILDLEGGWIAPAVAPQAWLLGVILMLMALTEEGFNLVLLFVFCFSVPRFILLLRTRIPRTDDACTASQRIFVGLTFIVLVVGLALLGTYTFNELTIAVPEAMGD